MLKVKNDMMEMMSSDAITTILMSQRATAQAQASNALKTEAKKFLPKLARPM